MTDIFMEFCTSPSECLKTIAVFFSTLFFSAPLLAIKNIFLTRYIVVISFILILGISYFLIQKKYSNYKYLLSGWIIGIILFWIGTAIFYKHGFPFPAWTLPSCGACGSDYPPLSSLGFTLLNISIRQLVGQGIAFRLGGRKSNRTLIILTIITVYIILLGFSGLAVLFD